MNLQFELSTQQIKNIASCISLKDVQDYIESHKEEYEQILKEEETRDTIDNTSNKQKKYSNDYSSIWSQYIDDVSCTVNTNRNMKGSEKNGRFICKD